MTAKRTTRHAPWIALVLLAAAILTAPAWPGAHIAVATGTVEVGRGEPPAWKAASVGDALGAGDRVRTGENGRAELALGAATLRLYPNSLLRLPDAGTAVDLDAGSSLFDVIHRSEPFEVRTPEVVVSVKGTRFSVAVDHEDASVSVFRGLVGVRSGAANGAPETLVQAGFAAFGHAKFDLTWLGSKDPWDGWGRGEALPNSGLGRGARRDALLRDARAAAESMSRELPHPAALAPEKEKGVARGDGSRLDAEKAKLESDASGAATRDAVADGSHELDTTLKESYVERMVNGPTGDLLQISLVDGSGKSGSDQVQIVSGATTWSFTEDQIEAIAEGEAALPANLTTLLQAQGVSQTSLTKQLLSLFK